MEEVGVANRAMDADGATKAGGTHRRDDLYQMPAERGMAGHEKEDHPGGWPNRSGLLDGVPQQHGQ